METSDSECFESADEDFDSDLEDTSIIAKADDAVTKEHKKSTETYPNGAENAQENKVEPKKKDISKLINKYLAYETGDQSDNKTNAAASDGVLKKGEGDSNNEASSEKSLKTVEVKKSENNKNQNRGYGIPPIKSSCWEPGMNYSMDSYNQTFGKNKKSAEATSGSDKKIGEESSKIPPKISSCWEPGMDYSKESYDKKFGGPKKIDEKEDSSNKNMDLKNEEEKLDEDQVKLKENVKEEESVDKKDKSMGKSNNLPRKTVDKKQESVDNQENSMICEKKDSENVLDKVDEKKSISNEEKLEDKGRKSKEEDKLKEKEKLKDKLKAKEEKLKVKQKPTKEDESQNKESESNEKEQNLKKMEEKSRDNEGKLKEEITEKLGNIKKITTETEKLEDTSGMKEQNDWEDDLWTNDEMDWGDQAPKQDDKVESKEENLWEDEEDLWNENEAWEPVGDDHKDTGGTKEDQQTKESESSGWGSWGGWGLSSVLSTATASVSTLTSHVSQGISTVLESGIGVPDPEDLARQHKLERENLKETGTEEEAQENSTNISLPSLGLTNLGNLVSGVSHITKLVEKTGTKVISGGLDTLETIGKKTMEVLQENDPGLKRKRAFLKIEQDKPILSQILREAKEKAEQESKSEVRAHKKPNYEAIFDDHQGLVHLEALEMLSKQCDIKLQSLSENLEGDELVDMQETLEQVKELCELPEEDDEEILNIADTKEKFESIVAELNVPIRYGSLFETWQEVVDWLDKFDSKFCSENEVHKQAIESLAHITAIVMEQYHKIGELLLVKEHRSTADEADSLVQLTVLLTALVSNVANNFSQKLTDISKIANNKEMVNELITNVFFEAANSSSYVKDAFQLIIPVLQVGAI